MIFVDSNVPMYLVGADHPNKAVTQSLLERFARERQRLVADAEVYQEVLHRFTALGRRDALQPTFDVLDALTDEVFPVLHDDVRVAKDLLGTHPALSARDAVHVAVMRREGVSRIFTFDAGFDSVAGLERLHGI
jgi:predicted nucleic acid-binding protein